MWLAMKELEDEFFIGLETVRSRAVQGGGRKAPWWSIVRSQTLGQMLKEVVEVAVLEVELLKDVGDALALLALGAEDGFNDHISGNYVVHAVGFDFIGADVEVFLGEEGLKVHWLRNGGVSPLIKSIPQKYARVLGQSPRGGQASAKA